MSDNMRLWERLGKTDPAHTKQFSRAGGFKGTALKPIWVIKMLTEHLGPSGESWGVNEPHFQVVPAGDEIMVYCTVSCWHGRNDNLLWGVGGDKVLTKRQSGSFADDEAFKKAFTDAVGNAFKYIGVGADIHMGQFDDSKYRDEVAEEFAERKAVAKPKPAERKGLTVAKLKEACAQIKAECGKATEKLALDEYLSGMSEVITQVKADKPDWWNNPDYGLDGVLRSAYERIEDGEKF